MPLLADHFLAAIAAQEGRAKRFSAEAMAQLQRYAWPGNVRELKNVVERAVYRTDAALITDIVFDPFPSSLGAGLAAAGEQPQALEPEAAAVDARSHQPFLAAVQAFETRRGMPDENLPIGREMVRSLAHGVGLLNFLASASHLRQSALLRSAVSLTTLKRMDSSMGMKPVP